MRCRIHPSDHSAGVCACCLRDRLSALTAAAAEHNAEPSPAILSSRSDFSIASNDGLKRRAVKSSLVYPIWGNSTPEKAESCAISNSRLLALIIKQLKKNKNKSPAAEDLTRGRSTKPHVHPVNGRGMSPAMQNETEEDERRITTPSPLKRKSHRQQSPSRLSSYVVCLSPMLRPSPGIHRNHYPMFRPSSGIHRNHDPLPIGDLILRRFSGDIKSQVERRRCSRF